MRLSTILIHSFILLSCIGILLIIQQILIVNHVGRIHHEVSSLSHIVASTYTWIISYITKLQHFVVHKQSHTYIQQIHTNPLHLSIQTSSHHDEGPFNFDIHLPIDTQQSFQPVLSSIQLLLCPNINTHLNITLSHDNNSTISTVIVRASRVWNPNRREWSWFPSPFGRCSCVGNISDAIDSGMGAGAGDGLTPAPAPASSSTPSCSSEIFLFDIDLAVGFNRLYIRIYEMDGDPIIQYINIWNGVAQQQQQQQQQLSYHQQSSIWHTRYGFIPSPIQSSLLGNVQYLLRSVMDFAAIPTLKPQPQSQSPGSTHPSPRIHSGYMLHQYAYCSGQSPDHTAILIYHGVIYIYPNDAINFTHHRHGHLSRTRAILSLLFRILRDTPQLLPDYVVFLLSQSDEPTGLTRYPHDQDVLHPINTHPQVDCPPVWGFTQSPSINIWRDRSPNATWRQGMKQAVIALPCFSFIGHAGYFSWWNVSRSQFDHTFRNLPPAQQRNQQLFFRDGGTGTPGERGTLRNILTKAGHNTTGSFVSLRKQCRMFRYQLYFGGHSYYAWSTRLKAQLLCGTPVIADRVIDSNTYYHEFWYPIIRQYIHFIPATKNTLLQQYSLCESNLEYCSHIGIHGHNMVYHTLTIEFIYEYMSEMLYMQQKYVNIWENNRSIPSTVTATASTAAPSTTTITGAALTSTPTPPPFIDDIELDGIIWTYVPYIPFAERDAHNLDISPIHA